MDTILLITIIIVLIASITQGATGFGFSLLSAPLLVIMYDPALVVPVVVITSSVILAGVMIETFKHIHLRRITPLIISSIVGIPFGSYLLRVADPGILKICIGLIVVVFAVALLAGFKRPVRRESLLFFPVGFVSGVLNSSTSMSGPPVILFFSNQDEDKQTFRANLVAFFLISNLIAIGYFFYDGVLTTEVWNLAWPLMITAVVGTIGGMAVARYLSEKLFKRIVLFIVCGAGVVGMLSGFGFL